MSSTAPSDGHAPDEAAEARPQQHGNAHDETVVIQAEETAAQAPATLVLREMLQGFAAGQEAILNSQQTNRNLLGVVIQDNFNLKEENARLRERMLKLEQELGEMRLAQTEYRQQLDQRLRRLEQQKDWIRRLLGF